MWKYIQRRALDLLVRAACAAAVAVALLPLVSVLGYVLMRGVPGLSLAFFTELPRPVGESGGGIGNALVGSLEIIGLGCVLAIPLGVLAGVHLAEFGSSRFALWVRLAADVLAGVPGITIGLFVYGLVVLTSRQSSAWAGAIALALSMLPGVVRSVEELLKLVPESLREAALGLGVSRSRTTVLVLLRTAAPGIGVGIMLAVARAAGETAPLLFTVFNNRFRAESLGEPTASLPVSIYTGAVSPYAEWHQRAWSGALVLVALIFLLNLASRLLLRTQVRSS